MGVISSLFGNAGSAHSIGGPSAATQSNAQNLEENAIKQQQGFLDTLKTQNGIGNQANVFGQEQALANQYGQIAQGQGPNPAQAALNQATGQNVANQAALMAGQRGAGANAGLIARQAAMQGGNLQQQAIGQNATLQAQQQLNALAAQQAQQNQMANLASTQVGQTQAGYNALGQLANQNQANVYGLQQSTNAANASLQAGQMGMQGQMFGGIAQGVGKGLASMNAEGGEITKADNPHSFLNTLNSMKTKMANGGKVPALVSPGEVYLKPKDVKEVAKGSKKPMDGEKIPGKPKVGGAKNDYANDTVHKNLDEGGIVIPRSVTQSPDSDRKAIEFVQAILSKHSKSLPKK